MRNSDRCSSVACRGQRFLAAKCERKALANRDALGKHTGGAGAVRFALFARHTYIKLCNGCSDRSVAAYSFEKCLPKAI